VNIIALFPTAVGKFKLDRDLTKEELEFVNTQEKRPNMGNVTSVKNYVLREEPLKTLGEFFLESANKYFQEIYKPSQNVSVYITQSWLNYTERNQYHHKHEHPNSFISGVFYVNGIEAEDRIHFYKNNYEQIKVPTNDFNIWNSDSWWLEAGTGTLYLFPSNLTHMVEQVRHEGTRISLSFNTFLKGTIGENNTLMELILGD
jgi:uncharacterized protein (TIGR02466 family)